jgi:hypothetical protein
MNYGIFLSYQDKERFLRAYRQLNQSSYSIETFTPYAIEETFSQPLLKKISPVKMAGLAGAFAGLIIGFGMQWFANVVYTPLNIGGRPLNSWPAFIPVTFVLMVLFSGVLIFITLMTKLNLPRPYQSVFNAENYHFEIGHFGILIHASGNLPDQAYLGTLKADHIEALKC